MEAAACFAKAIDQGAKLKPAEKEGAGEGRPWVPPVGVEVDGGRL
jgi:hypothetical protein